MTIDEQIAALDKRLVKEKMQLVRKGAKQFSAEYTALLAERNAFLEHRSTKGGRIEMALSASLSPSVSNTEIVNWGDWLKRKESARPVQTSSTVASARGGASVLSTNDAPTALRPGGY